MSQTILVTNRKLKKNGKSFLEKIDNDIHLAICSKEDKSSVVKRNGRKITFKNMKKTYAIKPVAKDREIQTLKGVSENNNNLPWLFFVHGNNQTLEKNLAKARRIQDLYNVNIVIFSWPSKSYKFRVFSSIKKLALSSSSKFALVAGIGKVLYGEKKGQYLEARKMAEKTAEQQQLQKSLTLINDHIFKSIRANNQEQRVNLLVHSLGHYLLKQAQPILESSYDSPIFDKAVFHQGDCASEGHDFLTRLSIVAPENCSITQNSADAILAASGIINSGLNNVRSRLGNDTNLEKVAPMSYIKLSGKVGLSHNPAWENGIDEEIFELFEPLISQ